MNDRETIDLPNDDQPVQQSDGPTSHPRLNGHAGPEPPPDIDDPGYHAAQEEDPANDPGAITEGTVADAFARRYRDQLRYCHHNRAWFVWDGARWRKEPTKLAFRWAHEQARAMSLIGSSGAVTAGKATFAAGVERLAQAHRALAVTSEIWDSDPWLLGTPGGTLDLRTGELRPAAREDYITKVTSVTPAETPDCPMWLNFLGEACAQDADFVRFLRQWCGYNLTGVTSEHALLFVHGPGGNGKSVFMGASTNIVGDYCKTAAMDTFTESRGDRHPTDIAALNGARMVWAAETEEGHAWSEIRLKQLTGGDRISARFMRHDFFEFTPGFKLSIIGNHQPNLHNVDDAAKRRINMAPFVHKPPIPDKHLEEKLRAEYPAILRWMIEGGLDWQKNGLVRPDVVTTSTTEYFDAQDLMAQWLDERCERTDNLGNPAKDTCNSLMTSWRNYAKSHGEEPRSSKGFGIAMRQRGFTAIRNQHGITGRGFLGIKVKIHLEPPQDD
jgi:putative DNA primase/helicase